MSRHHPTKAAHSSTFCNIAGRGTSIRTIPVLYPSMKLLAFLLGWTWGPYRYSSCAIVSTRGTLYFDLDGLENSYVIPLILMRFDSVGRKDSPGEDKWASL